MKIRVRGNDTNLAIVNFRITNQQKFEVFRFEHEPNDKITILAASVAVPHCGSLCWAGSVELLSGRTKNGCKVPF